MGISLLTLALWAYIRYSGELTDFGVQLDDFASLIWNNFLKPIYKTCMEKGIQQVASHAADAVVGGSSESSSYRQTSSSSPSSSSNAANGKVKSS